MKILLLTLLLAFTTPLNAQPQGGRGTVDPDQMFIQQADTDKDGKVSQQEFLTPGQKQFEHMDRNSDGYITIDEARAFGQEIRQHTQEQQQMQQRQRGGQPGQPGVPRGQYEQPGGYGQTPSR